MAKKKISELPAGGALNGTELVPIVQTGTTKQITAQDIANLGNASGVEGSGTINRLAKFTASSTIGNSQLFDDGTSVGLGTITPLGLLHLFKASATTRLVMDGNASQSKIITYRTNGVQRFGLYLNNTPESGANAGSDFAIRAYSDAGTLLTTPLFIKRSTGNVGIGTIAPNTKLEIQGSTDLLLNLTRASVGSWGVNVTSAGNLFLNNRFGTTILTLADLGAATFSSSVTATGLNVSGVGNALNFDTTGLAQSAFIKVVEDFKLSLKLNRGTTSEIKIGNENLEFLTNNINRLTILDSGNVGIGNTNPTNALDVYNTTTNARINIQGTTNPVLSQYTNSSGPLYIGIDDSAGANYTGTPYARFIYSAFNYPLAIFTDGTERMRITGTGNVGIGTTTPTDKVTISGATGYTGISIDTGNATGGAYLAIKQNGVSSGFFGGSGAALGDTSSDLALYAETSKGIRFYTNGSGSERMRIFTDGNIAINSASNAGYKLDVNGTARVSGALNIKTSTAYSDLNIGDGSASSGIVIKATSGSTPVTIPTKGLQFNTGYGVSYITSYNSVDALTALYFDASSYSFGGGPIAINNPVTTAVAVASTHKVEISINGTTYYLLATT